MQNCIMPTFSNTNLYNLNIRYKNMTTYSLVLKLDLGRLSCSYLFARTMLICSYSPILIAYMIQ